MDIAREVVILMISELSTRKGFDHWWYGIDVETREEIAVELAKIAYRRINRRQLAIKQVLEEMKNWEHRSP